MLYLLSPERERRFVQRDVRSSEFLFHMLTDVIHFPTFFFLNLHLYSFLRQKEVVDSVRESRWGGGGREDFYVFHLLGKERENHSSLIRVVDTHTPVSIKEDKLFKTRAGPFICSVINLYITDRRGKKKKAK